MLKWNNQIAVVLVIIGCGLVAQCAGQTRLSDAALSGELIDIDNTRILLPEIKVLNQDGSQVYFYSDLIRSRVVLLSFFYTTCLNVCPQQAVALSNIQTQLGSKLGRQVFLISISMNPEVDSPRKLKQWAKVFKARAGWTLVSSNTTEMKQLIKSFTGNSVGPKDLHASMVFIGNDRTGKWFTMDGLSDPTIIVDALERSLKTVESR